MSEALYRRYRPKSFAEVAGQKHVIDILRNQIARGLLGHAYLFSGPRGVGKTTVARLLAKAANCLNTQDGEPCQKCASCEKFNGQALLDIVEIDAASHTGVDNVREMIIENARFLPAQLPRKIFIIDEVHMLSSSAFNALLKVLEEPPEHVIFILATTEPQKIPATVVSRCQRFDFHRLPADILRHRLNRLVKLEKTKVATEIIEAIIKRSDGSSRDAEVFLDQVLAAEDPLLVLPPSCEGDVLDFLEMMAGVGAKPAIDIVQSAVGRGVRPAAFLEETLQILRRLLLLSVGLEETGETDSEQSVRWHKLANQLGSQRLQEMLRTLTSDRRLFESGPFPTLPLEVFAANFAVSSSADGGETLKIKKQAQAVSSPEAVDNSNTVDKSPTSESNLTLETIKEKWNECCRRISEVSATLPVVLRNCQLIDWRDGQLQLSFAYEFHARQVNDQKHRRLIEEILGQQLNEPITVVANYVPSGQDEAVAELIHQFGGTVA